MEQFEKFVLGVITGMAFVMITFIMTSCSSTKIAHTPSKREIKRAMKYSTSEYIMPHVQTNISQVYDPHQ
jgi:hypothetical protein